MLTALIWSHSTFAVVSGATGGGLGVNVILILGFSNIIADAISMGVGDALSTKAENEYILRERGREEWELENDKQGEIREMVEIFVGKGMSKEDATDIITKFAKWVSDCSLFYAQNTSFLWYDIVCICLTGQLSRPICWLYDARRTGAHGSRRGWQPLYVRIYTRVLNTHYDFAKYSATVISDNYICLIVSLPHEHSNSRHCTRHDIPHRRQGRTDLWRLSLSSCSVSCHCLPTLSCTGHHVCQFCDARMVLHVRCRLARFGLIWAPCLSDRYPHSSSVSSLSTQALFAISCALTATTLFILGAIKTKVTYQPWWRGGLEILVMGSCTAGAAFFIGYLVELAVTSGDVVSLHWCHWHAEAKIFFISLRHTWWVEVTYIHATSVCHGPCVSLLPTYSTKLSKFIIKCERLGSWYV